jgi:hypothetical protein
MPACSSDGCLKTSLRSVLLTVTDLSLTTPISKAPLRLIGTRHALFTFCSSRLLVVSFLCCFEVAESHAALTYLGLTAAPPTRFGQPDFLHPQVNSASRRSYRTSYFLRYILVAMAAPPQLPPIPNKEDGEATWKFLEVGVDRIMRDLDKGMDLKTYMALYTAIHNFCTAQKAVGSGTFNTQQNRGGGTYHGVAIGINSVLTTRSSSAWRGALHPPHSVSITASWWRKQGSLSAC